MTDEPEPALKSSYYRLMVYAALFGALSSLLAAAYITLYNGGIKFFEQPSLFVLNINIWPLVLLTVGGVLIGLAIKFFGEHAGLGIAQRQYAQTGRLNPRYVPRILLEAFIALWSGAAVGPEGPLVFLSGGSWRKTMSRCSSTVPSPEPSVVSSGHQSLGRSVPSSTCSSRISISIAT
jgi:H+/Cl- antiporter ClcA